MKRVYLNGEFLAADEAKVSIFDRGFLFADGVYEVIPCYHKVPFQLDLHLQRLRRSLAATKIELEQTDEELAQIIGELSASDDQLHHSVYLQITRGTEAARSHAYQDASKPSLVMFTQELALPDFDKKGVSVQTAPDTRWQNCNIKSIALLGNVLTLSDSKQSGFDDVIYHRQGAITESSTSNVFIAKDGRLATPPRSNFILHGITRHMALLLAKQLTIPTQERNITVSELVDADEVLLTSSSKGIIAVTSIDGRPVGTGEKGPVWRQLFSQFEQSIEQMCCPAEVTSEK